MQWRLIMWAIDNETYLKIKQGYLHGLGTHKAEILALDEYSDNSNIYSTDAETANIYVKGALTQEPDWVARFFGGGNTTYKDILSAISQAEKNNNVKNITFQIESPGGNIDGLFDVFDAIQGVTKPTKALLHNVCASAAYLIASACDEVVAKNATTRIGSVGILYSTFIEEGEVNIASTEAPHKAPDLSTDEGKAIIRTHIDDMHNEFVGAIAKGRKKDVDYVNASFGRGGTFLAKKALDAGMIDSIQAKELKNVDNKTVLSINNEKPTESKAMDINELKAQHSALYAQVLAEGVASERDRVVAHLTSGKASGGIDIAIEAIEKGDLMNQTLIARYFASGMNSRDISARDVDGIAATVVDGAKKITADSESLLLAKELAEKHNVKF